MAATFFSENPDKAWTERVLLVSSLAWIAMMAAVVLTGAMRRWSDVGYLVFSLACAAPMTALPVGLWFARRAKLEGSPRFRDSYLLKLLLFVFVVMFFGTYVGTAYFFDLMGMRYAFPTKWVFESGVVGRTGGHVPVIMYPLTQAYFMTYFTVLTVADRAVSSVLGLRDGRSLAHSAGRAVVVLCLAYAIAFAETFFMATDLMKDLFSYEKHGKMLAIGSIGYASYFIVGLPIVRRFDERAPQHGVARPLVDALASSMLTLVLLEVYAKLVGPL
ncbi:MAG: hypothetical protein U0271_31025 [Polyangiaceae bacterium]